jgi:hypothetical protein
VADNFPLPPTPESGEDQYRRWVEHMKSNLRASRLRPAETPTPATEGASTDAAAGGDTTLVMDTAGWFVDDHADPERSVLPRPIVSMSQSRVEAAPGQPVRLKVTVRNVGPVVETYSLSVVGPEGSWLSVVPSEVSLFPGSEGSAALIIKPGRTSKLPAGDYTVGVMARSEVDPHESTVTEVTISVTPFYDSNLSLSRTTIDIRRRATTFAQITNNGNAFVDYRLDVADPDGYLRFKVEDPDFTLAPGDTIWKKVTVSAPLHIFGSSRTLSMVASLTSVRDHTSGMPLEEIRPSIQRVTLVQRPAIRFRLGLLGRILLILLIAGLVVAFVLSRAGLTGTPDLKVGPPPPPQGLTATAYEGSQVLLTWQASPGAQGYSIYAVGSTGNALMAASPSPSASPSASASASASAPAAVTAATPTATPASTTAPASTPTPTASAAATPSASAAPSATPTPTTDATTASLTSLGSVRGSLRAVRMPVRTGGDASPAPSTGSVAPSQSPSAEGATSTDVASSTSSPTASPTSVAGDQELAETGIESPSCGDCTHVADVPTGTTRYIVTKTMPGQQNCYRIIATAGSSSSLYTPSECVEIPAADGSTSATSTSSTGSSSGSTSASTSGVCPPYMPLASALTSTSVAITWLPPTDYKEPSSSSDSSKKTKKGYRKFLKWKVGPFTTADRAGRTFVIAGGGSSSGSTAPPPAQCNPQAPVTGFELQRQILDGWTTISPAPTANDTAFEVGGLQPDTKYCFRMRSQATPSPSAYTDTFCATTESSTASTATPAATSTPTPTPTPAVVDPTGTSPTPAAAVIIEGVRSANLNPMASVMD